MHGGTTPGINNIHVRGLGQGVCITYATTLILIAAHVLALANGGEMTPIGDRYVDGPGQGALFMHVGVRSLIISFFYKRCCY